MSKTVDKLSKEKIINGLSFNADLILEDCLTSTNEVAKQSLLSDTPLLVIANRQTKGKGRLGREFYSPADTGIYMSYAFKRENLDLITVAAAVATVKAIESTAHVKPEIKWVNDILLDNRKIAGILTEGVVNPKTGKIDACIIGIGINCFTEFFPEFKRNTPGSIGTSSAFTRNELIASIANKLYALLEKGDGDEIIAQYRSMCSTIGKEITIYRRYNDSAEKGIKAKAIDIARNGGLLVEYDDNTQEILSSGEISIR